MKFEMSENGKLTLIVKYDPIFEFADMFPNDLESMKDMGIHYVTHGGKAERRLAKRLLHAVTWIEREIWSIQNKDK